MSSIAHPAPVIVVAILKWAMEISSLTLSDRVFLLANFEISANKRFQCDPCLKTIAEPTRRNVKGCFGFPGVGGYQLALNNIPEFKVSTCLGNLWNSEAFFWMKAFSFFKKGVMPFEGVFLDQPAKAIEAFNLIEALEQEFLEKQEASKSKGGSHGR